MPKLVFGMVIFGSEPLELPVEPHELDWIVVWNRTTVAYMQAILPHRHHF